MLTGIGHLNLNHVTILTNNLYVTAVLTWQPREKKREN